MASAHAGTGSCDDCDLAMEGEVLGRGLRHSGDETDLESDQRKSRIVQICGLIRSTAWSEGNLIPYSAS